MSGRTPRSLLPARVGVPVRPVDLDAAWFTAALGPDLLGDAVVDSVELSTIGAGRGHLGANVLAEIAYRGEPAPGAPHTVVVKMPADAESSRDTSARGRLYEREYRYFTELADDTPARAPRCFAAGYDVVADEFVLVLEDVRGRTEREQLDGCPADLAVRIAVEVARIHAPWWRCDRLRELSWLTSAGAPARVSNTSRFLEQGWPEIADELEERTGLPAGRIGERVLEVFPECVAGLDDEAHTLLHGDLRLDNMTFEVGPDAEPVVLLDWQNVSRGAPAMDLAYFMAQNLTPETFRESWLDIVRAYLDQLHALGAVELTEDRLVETIRRSVPFTFAVAASVIVLGGGSVRSRQLGLVMGERALVAAAETGLLTSLGIR